MAMKKSNWTVEDVKELLKTNDKAVIRGLLRIYALQTEEEKNAERTLVYNGVGFNGVDAGFMSSLAQFYQKKGFLSKKQMMYARKKMLKYAGQLVKIIEGDKKVAENQTVIKVEV